MSHRTVRLLLAGVVVVVAALVLLGVGQGKPGPQVPVTRAEAAAARARLAALGEIGAAGQADFARFGCNACHTIGVSGYGGRLGPNLDGYLQGVPAPAIRDFIVDPLSVRIPGFTHDLMPNDFARRLSPSQLNAIVAYLRAVAG